jgi:DNA-binding SARP family transcriptional activator
MEAHLREGNPSEAIRQFKGYRTLLWEELRMPPSQRMRMLITNFDNGA